MLVGINAQAGPEGGHVMGTLSSKFQALPQDSRRPAVAGCPVRALHRFLQYCQDSHHRYQLAPHLVDPSVSALPGKDVLQWEEHGAWGRNPRA